jgi:nucleotide-binding universal stress UspA family protein
VLVPLDGSALAELALPWGLRLAEQRRAPLLLARAVPPAYTAVPNPAAAIAIEHLMAAEVAAAGTWLDERAAGIRAATPGAEVRTAVRLGDPASVLLRLEREARAQLVVMGTHGRSGTQRWVRGSVAESVLRRGAAPVLLVRPGADPARAARLTRTGGRILVPLDGSDLAAAAVPEAARSVAPGGHLVLATVLPPAASGTGGTCPAGVPAHALAQHRLESVALELRRRGLRATAVVLTAGDPAAALVDLATLEEVDLIVLATHGRGGLGRWLYGSVADAISRTAPVPVLLVRPLGGARPPSPTAPAERPAAAPLTAGPAR